MIWLTINGVIVVIGVFVTLVLVRLSRTQVEKAHETNSLRAEAEFVQKKEILEKLSFALRGLISETDFEDADKQIAEIEGSLNAEKGKIAITETELDSLDIRLRELEELKRELEASNLDAIKEVDMLKAQERDIANQNEAILQQLASSSDQLDILLDMFSNNEEAVTQLTKSKGEMIEVEKSIAFYEEEIAKVNEHYIGLKKAYDALDIEYAQLYEKRQAQLDGSEEEEGES